MPTRHHVTAALYLCTLPLHVAEKPRIMRQFYCYNQTGNPFLQHNIVQGAFKVEHEHLENAWSSKVNVVFIDIFPNKCIVLNYVPPVHMHS